MILNKNFLNNEIIIIVFFAILLYSLSNVININKHNMVKGLLLLFSVIICSKCSMPTGFSCSLLLIVYLYVINSKQKESFNAGRVGQGLDDIAEGILHGAEDVGEGIVDGVKDVGGGLSKASHDLFGNSNDANSDTDTDSDSDSDYESDSDSDPYSDDDHPGDSKEQIDTSEEDKMYKQYEKCMYGGKILDDNADDYECDINDRIDHVNKMDKTHHCGDNRHKHCNSCGNGGGHGGNGGGNGISKQLKSDGLNDDQNIHIINLPKIKTMVSTVHKDMKTVKLLIRKFYKSIDDKSLIQRNLIDARDAFDKASEQVIRMDFYVQKLDKIDKKSNNEILNYIKDINDNMKLVDLSNTVIKTYKYSEEQQDIKKAMSKGAFGILTNINTIKQLII